MAHGTRDWGITAGARTTFQLTDLAEHAVRLGSPDSFERAGEVMFLDDFEAGLARWTATAFGTGAGVELSTARVRNGLLAALLTAGSDGGEAVQMRHTVAVPTLASLGCEVSFNPGSWILSFQLDINAYDGANLHAFGVRWVQASQELEYYDETYSWTPFATGVVLPADAETFTTMKLVADPDASEYTRLRFNATTYDMAGLSPVVVASGLPVAIAFQLRLNGRAANNDFVYVDDVILTQNEPV